MMNIFLTILILHKGHVYFKYPESRDNDYTYKGHVYFKYPESRDNDYTYNLQHTENSYITILFT